MKKVVARHIETNITLDSLHHAQKTQWSYGPYMLRNKKNNSLHTPYQITTRMSIVINVLLSRSNKQKRSIDLRSLASNELRIKPADYPVRSHIQPTNNLLRSLGSPTGSSHRRRIPVLGYGQHLYFLLAVLSLWLGCRRSAQILY